MSDMTFDDWLDKVNESQKLDEQIKEAEQLVKDFKATKRELDEELVRYSIDNMLGTIERNGKKIKCKFKTKVRIKESKFNKKNRIEFFERLVDAGFGDDIEVFHNVDFTSDKIIFYDDYDIDKRKWDKLISQVPTPIIAKAEKDGLVYIETVPDVSVK